MSEIRTAPSTDVGRVLAASIRWKREPDIVAYRVYPPQAIPLVEVADGLGDPRLGIVRGRAL